MCKDSCSGVKAGSWRVTVEDDGSDLEPEIDRHNNRSLESYESIDEEQNPSLVANGFSPGQKLGDDVEEEDKVHYLSPAHGTIEKRVQFPVKARSLFEGTNG